MRATLQDDIDIDCVPEALDPCWCTFDRRIMLDERSHQRLLDAENNVRFEIGARRVEDVGGHRGEAACTDDQVQVRRPPRMSPGRREHLPDGPVVRDRVRRRSHADERVAAVVAREEPAAQVILLGLHVLHGVELVRAVLPRVAAFCLVAFCFITMLICVDDAAAQVSPPNATYSSGLTATPVVPICRS